MISLNHMKINFTIKLVILFIFTFFFGQSALAASLELNVEKNILQQDQVFVLTISLNTEGQSINTLEGDLKYDANFIKTENINIGGSFINFWVEKPDIKTPGIIHFSGITPGGISTINGGVFKVMFRTLKTGNTSLLLNNVNLFLNDGQGSAIPAKIKNENIIINQGASDNSSANFVFNDKIPPEKFNIIRAKDPTIFDNKWFIVFSTVDKGSGVDHYQVCEGERECIIAESPYLLKNQSLDSEIIVKAEDRNGNTRIIVIPPQKTHAWYKNYSIFAIVILVVTLIYFIWKIFRKKR